MLLSHLDENQIQQNPKSLTTENSSLMKKLPSRGPRMSLRSARSTSYRTTNPCPVSNSRTVAQPGTAIGSSGDPTTVSNTTRPQQIPGRIIYTRTGLANSTCHGAIRNGISRTSAAGTFPHPITSSAKCVFPQCTIVHALLHRRGGHNGSIR